MAGDSPTIAEGRVDAHEAEVGTEEEDWKDDDDDDDDEDEDEEE